MSDDLEKAICESTVSSVANHGFSNDKAAQLAWLKIAKEKYGLSVRYYIEGNETLATQVSGAVR